MSEKSNIYEALGKFQEKVGVIAKNAKGQKGHRHFTYADLPAIMDQIQPILTECKLAISQGLEWTHDLPEHALLETTVCHWPSGESIESNCPFKMNSDPQEAGKEISYYRRYGILGIFNLVTDDDLDKPRAAPKARAAARNTATTSTPGTKPTGAPEPTGDKTKFHRTDHPCPNCNVTVFWSPKDKYPATYTCWKKADPDPGCGWKGLDPTVKTRSSAASAAEAVEAKTGGDQFLAETHAQLDAIDEELEHTEDPAALLEDLHKFSEGLAASDSYAKVSDADKDMVRARWKSLHADATARSEVSTT